MILVQILLGALAALILFFPNAGKEINSSIPFLVVVILIEALYLAAYLRKRSRSASDITSISAAVLIVWELAAKTGIAHPVLVPSPENVFYVFYAYGGDMLLSLYSSMKLLVLGIGFAMFFGIFGGLFVGYVPRLRGTILPIARVISTIPPLVYTPYVVAVMPSFYISSIFIIFSAVFWPSFMGMMARVGSVDKRIIESARVMNFTSFGMIMKVILPYSMPDVIGRLSTSLTAAMLCLTGAEMLGASSGLGYFVKKYADYADYTKVIAGIIWIGIVTTVLNMVVTKLQEKVIRWKY